MPHFVNKLPFAIGGGYISYFYKFYLYHLSMICLGLSSLFLLNDTKDGEVDLFYLALLLFLRSTYSFYKHAQHMRKRRLCVAVNASGKPKWWWQG